MATDLKLSELGSISSPLMDTDLIYVVRSGTSPFHFAGTVAQLKLVITATKLDTLTAPNDNTTLDASSSLHGLMSKLDKAKLDIMQGAEVDVASATTTDIGAATADNVRITGTVTITGLGTVAAGTRRFVRFAGALVLTHDNAALILPNAAANITTAAGDAMIAESLGSGNWKVLVFMPASGKSPGLSAVTNNAQTQAAIVPNTTPSAGQLLVGNAGGTAFAVVSSSGDVTIASTGAMTIAVAAVTLAKMADLAQDQFIGRTTGSMGVPQTTTITAAARTVLDDTTVSAMVDTLGGASAGGTGGLARLISTPLVTPLLGTPNSGVLTNCTGLPVATGIANLGTGVATALAINVGSAGAPVVFNGALGTPSSGNVTGCTAKIELGFACSDETTAITAATGKLTFRMPIAMTLSSVFVSVTTAPTGSTFIMDIKKAGTSIFSTKPSIDVSEFDTSTAATPSVLSTTSFAIADLMVVNFDQVGSTIAGAGVKMFLIGTRT